MSDQTIQDVLYLIDAWERGAYADEYPTEIASLRQELAAARELKAENQELVEALQQCERYGGEYTNGEPEYATTDWEAVAADQAMTIALAQPEQEPVAWNGWVLREVFFDNGDPCGHREPPSKPWVSLTEKERRTFASWLDDKTDDEVFNAIEAKLKEKNYD